jgi:hypothetical protein
VLPDVLKDLAAVLEERGFVETHPQSAQDRETSVVVLERARSGMKERVFLVNVDGKGWCVGWGCGQSVVSVGEVLVALDGEPFEQADSLPDIAQQASSALRLVQRLSVDPAARELAHARFGDEPEDPALEGRGNDPCWCGSGKKLKRCHRVLSSVWERELGPVAFEYLRESLWLARGLEPFLQHVVVSERFGASTVADAQIPDERLLRFITGGLGHAIDLPHLAGDRAARAMSDSPTARWVVPDPMARPTDRFLADSPVRPVVIDDGVYYAEARAIPHRLADAWAAAASAAGNLGLVTTEAPDGQTAAAPDLQRIAEGTQLLVVTAYDGEGLAFFTRR